MTTQLQQFCYGYLLIATSIIVGALWLHVQRFRSRSPAAGTAKPVSTGIDRDAAEALLLRLTPPKRWGSHLPELGPEHYAGQLSSASVSETLYDEHGLAYGLKTTPGLPPRIVIADLDFRMRANNEWVATQRYLGNISDEEYNKWLLADFVYYPPLLSGHNEL